MSLVTKERMYYREACKKCKDNVQMTFTVEEKYIPQQVRDFPTTNLYRFTIQVIIPLQPGTIYFLNQRKCTIFGVSCEGLLRQVIYF